MLKSRHALGPKTFLGKLVRLPLKLIPRGHVTTVRGGINKGFRWIVGSGIHGCWLGTYESDKQDVVSKLVRPGMVIWDIGANAGFYTLAFSRLVGDTGNVYAFEPLAENANNILTHVRLNKLTNTHIIQVAVAGEPGLIGFSVAASNAMGHISQQESSYLVPTLTADELIARFPHAKPDLIKIDVEGAESLVLSGATQLLRDSAPEIVLALHGEAQSRMCADILHSHGYSLYYLDGSSADSLPLKSDEIVAKKSSAMQPVALAGAETSASRR